jgi:membrane protein
VLVSVLGFVLENDPSLQQDVLDSALARIPVVGSQLEDEIQPLTGSTAALVIGLAGAVWAGLGVAAALVVNTAIFLAAFGLLTVRPVRVRELLPGVALAAAGSLLLQPAGGWYVEGTIARGSDTYGTFALVIGLLSWFWLSAHLLLLAAELNVVLRRRLWPRALAGDLLPADRSAPRRTAEAVRRDQRQEIIVRFSDDPR